MCSVSYVSIDEQTATIVKVTERDVGVTRVVTRIRLLVQMTWDIALILGFQHQLLYMTQPKKNGIGVRSHVQGMTIDTWTIGAVFERKDQESMGVYRPLNLNGFRGFLNSSW